MDAAAAKLCAADFAQGHANPSNIGQDVLPLSPHLLAMAARAADNAMKEIAMLKKLVIGAALAALPGTTALAQSYDPDLGGGNINPPIASLQGQQAPNPDSAFAYVPPRMHTTRPAQLAAPAEPADPAGPLNRNRTPAMRPGFLSIQ
jgi:hypothetical protein